MTGTLNPGHRLRTADGREITVEEFLGAGGQGEVYRVRLDAAGPPVHKALKWYYAQAATDQQHMIVEELVGRGFDDDRFLWPQALVVTERGGLGYLMDLLPPAFEGLPALFRREVKVGYRELLTACVHLVEAYRTLHSKGIAYRDISYGNVLFDPANGDVLVCDNDNAIVEGHDSGVQGTMEFMAPELVRDDPDAKPCTQTDLHSLAVLLFMMLMNHHPLEGALEHRIRCLDEKAKQRLYGEDPVFVYDPSDPRNRPVPGVHDTIIATWQAAPAPVRDLFVRAFTEGLRRPEARVRESQWREVLSQARDHVMPCRACGRQNVYGPGTACWMCGTALTPPPSVELTTAAPRVTRTVLLPPDGRIYEHHLHAEPDRHDYTAVLAEVAEHPRVPGRHGLRNLTTAAWTARRPDGTTAEVPPGRSIDLADGVRLTLGNAEAVLRTG
ncbi:protein kinase domain-containing protein [Spirillospora sp. CA-253888]